MLCDAILDPPVAPSSLDLYLVCLNLCIWSEALDSLCCNLSFALPNMVCAEQKLSVQITSLNCVHVNLHIQASLACPICRNQVWFTVSYHVNVDKPSQNQDFQQLASNAPSTNTKHFGSFNLQQQVG